MTQIDEDNVKCIDVDRREGSNIYLVDFQDHDTALVFSKENENPVIWFSEFAEPTDAFSLALSYKKMSGQNIDMLNLKFETGFNNHLNTELHHNYGIYIEPAIEDHIIVYSTNDFTMDVVKISPEIIKTVSPTLKKQV